MTSALISESISSLLSWPVGNIMNNDAIILEADKNLDEAIKKMKEEISAVFLQRTLEK